MSSLKVPESLEEEHEELMAALAEASVGGGRTAASIRDLLVELRPHFEKENRLVMPLLGLLAAVGPSELPHGSPEVRKIYDECSAEYDAMFAEHDGIRRLVAKAKAEAETEGRENTAETLKNLAHHARVEEEVLYPAALLVGRAALELVRPAAGP